MNKKISNEIIEILSTIIIDPKCELDYHNNFELLCAVMLSAQTTDKRVNSVTKILFEKYPNSCSLASSNYEEVYEIIKPLGLAKIKTNNIIKLAHYLHYNLNDVIPSDLNQLIKLPGVGRKTASVILALGFNIPALPVDTHLFRMAKRLGYIKEDEDILKAEQNYKKYIPKEKWIDAHHYFLLFGRYYCKAVNPMCDTCKLIKYCKKR